MSVATIYTTQFCPYCVRAKYMMDKKNIPYTEVSVDGDVSLRREMMARSGRHTVPQIWIGDEHIGGCDDLMLLERTGELDVLVSA